MHLTDKTICQITTVTLFLVILLSGCRDKTSKELPQYQRSGSVIGTVQDENGNSYPNTQVKLSKGSETLDTTTDSQGNFDFNTEDIGTYEITIIPPLSTMPVTAIPVMVDVQADQAARVDFVIQVQPVKAQLNFGNVDTVGEIKDKDGNVPVSPNALLYASNIFDEPLGLLTAIKAPDSHHVTLAEWRTAQGNVKVSCDGNTSTVDLTLGGMIPNGTYTLWLAFLNKKKKVGQSIDFATDLVHDLNSPLGSGTENVVIASANGTINTTIQHASCILTDAVALVIPVSYHINGNTFGAAHTPDTEDVAHMLVYFQ